VGAAGRIAYSTDRAVSWTLVSNSITQGFNAIYYSTTTSTFIAVGTEGIVARSTTGSTWSYDTTSLPALLVNGDSGSYDGLAVVYNPGNGYWHIAYYAQDTQSQLAWSTDDGVTWEQSDSSPYGENFINSNLSVLSANSLWWGQGDKVRQLGTPEAATTSTISGQTLSYGSDVQAVAKYGNLNFYGMGDGDFYANGGNAIMYHSAGNNQGSQVNAVAYSSVHSRFVIARDGDLEYVDVINFTNDTRSVPINHSFAPGVDFTAIIWDNYHGVFVVGASDGSIAVSTTGI
jgi:hypothetical protein